MILNVEALDPSGAQIIADHLSHANSLPTSPSPLVEDKHAVGPGESVEIRQILTCEAQANSLDETAGCTVDVLVDRGENCVIQIPPDAHGRACLHSGLILMCAEALHIVTYGRCYVSHRLVLSNYFNIMFITNKKYDLILN